MNEEALTIVKALITVIMTMNFGVRHGVKYLPITTICTDLSKLITSLCLDFFPFKIGIIMLYFIDLFYD